MAYNITTANQTAVTISDNVLNLQYYDTNTNRGIRLPGDGVTYYGASVLQNFLQLVENFASPIELSAACTLQGQLWFDTASGMLKIKTNNSNTSNVWKALATADQVIPPGGTTNQALVKNSNLNYDVKWATVDNTVYIPYTGATNNVNLGTYSLTASNLTGSNTGDETTFTIKTKLGITTLSGSNTGDSTAINQVLTGYSSTIGTISAADTILSAINKLNGNIAANNVVNVKQFGAIGDGVTDDTVAIQAAINQHNYVYIPDGNWNIKNIIVENCTVIFSPGAQVTSILNDTDVCIRMSNYSKLINPKIEITNSAPPIHGGYGCAIAIGYYANISQRATNVRIENPILTCNNSTRLAIAISVLGNADDICINNSMINGAYAIAFQAHWGGIFDEADPHASIVTASMAPNNIRVNGLIAGPKNSRVGEIAISIAGCFDIHINNIISNGWKRALLLTPGDVYAQVSTADQSLKIMTGIILDGIRVSNPESNNGLSAESPVFIAGISATVRTSIGKKTYTTDGNCGITVKNVKFDTNNTYTGAPLAYIYYASKVRLHIESISGFGSVTSNLIRILGSSNCKLKIDSFIQNLGTAIIANESVNCKISVNSAGSINTALNVNTKVFETGTYASVTTTTYNILNTGDTEITLNSIAGGHTLMAGTRLYIESLTEFLTVTESVLISETGITVVKISKSLFTLNLGSLVTIKRNLINSNVEIQSCYTYIPVQLKKVDCVEVKLICNQSSKYDVLVDGSENRNLIIKGIFSGCGSGNATGLLANIYISGGENIFITESLFEPACTAFVDNNIYAALAVDLSSLKITNNFFGGSTQRSIYLPEQTNTASAIGKNQVWGNSVKNGVQLLLETIATGCFISNKFCGYLTAVAPPTSGAWDVGDRIYDSTPTTGSPKSWVCTVAGTPGTWVSEGNL